MSMSLPEFVAKYFPDAKRQGKGYRARCPVHGDERPSLDIDPGDNGGILLKCRSKGCERSRILAAVEASQDDIAAPGRNGHARAGWQDDRHWDDWSRNKWGELVDVYAYTLEDGTVAKYVCRTIKDGEKFFPQRRRENGRLKWGVKGLPVVVYRLHLIAKADPSTTTVYLVEGEKDVHTLEDWGLLATCNDQGAEKFTAAHAKWLRGRSVVIVGDNDKAGRDHVALCKRLLRGVAASVCVLELPDLAEKEDVTDWRDKHGGTKERLQELLEERLQSRGDDEVCRESADLQESDKPEPELSPLKPRSLYQLSIDCPKLNEPLIDGLLRRGELANVVSETKLGKSWWLMRAAITCTGGGLLCGRFRTTPGKVLYLDNELHGGTIHDRAFKVGDAMELSRDAYQHAIDFVTLRGQRLDIYQLGKFLEQVDPGHYSYVMLDALYRAWPTGLSENENAAWTEVQNCIEAYAERLQVAWLTVHHSTKGLQGDKRVVDVGAGGGSQSRTADAHIVIRQHETPGVAVVDAALRSFKPIDPFCLRWEFPLWQPADDCDPAQLKVPKKAASKPPGQPQTQFALMLDRTREALASGEPMTKYALRKVTKASGKTINEVLEVLIETGEVEQIGEGNRAPFRLLESDVVNVV